MSSPQSVPPEAVEAAALALGQWTHGEWDSLTPRVQSLLTSQARIILTAAQPHLIDPRVNELHEHLMFEARRDRIHLDDVALARLAELGWPVHELDDEPREDPL